MKVGILNNKLLSNFLSLLSLQGLSFILPLLTAPYLFRVLGAEKFGLVSFSLVIMAFLRIIVDYGFQLTATREIALNINSKHKINNIVSKVFFTKFYLLLFTFLLLVFATLTIDTFSNDKIVFYLSFLFVVGHALFPMWFFQGIEEMKYISYLNIAAKLLFAISIFIFIKNPDDYLLYPLFNGISIIIIGVFSIYLLKKKYTIELVFQPIEKIMKTLKDGWNIFLGEIAPTFYTNFTMFLLGLFVSMESVGYLTLANRLVSATTSIIYIGRNVTFPYLNKNFEKFKKITLLMIGMGVFFTIFLLTLSHLFVPLLFGEKSKHILNLVYILSLSPFLYSIILSFGSNYLLVLKKDKIYKKTVIGVSLFGSLLSLVLVPTFHLYGGAVTILIGQILLSLLLVKTAIYIKKIHISEV